MLVQLVYGSCWKKDIVSWFETLINPEDASPYGVFSQTLNMFCHAPGPNLGGYTDSFMLKYNTRLFHISMSSRLRLPSSSIMTLLLCGRYATYHTLFAPSSMNCVIALSAIVPVYASVSPVLMFNRSTALLFCIRRAVEFRNA